MKNADRLSQITDARIQKVLNKFAVTANWYPSRLCSCIADNNGVRDPSCECINGFWYDDPIEVSLLRTAAKYKDVITVNGVLRQGDAVFTIPRYFVNERGMKEDMPIHYLLTKGDALVLPAYTHTDTDMLTRTIRDSVWTFDIEAILAVSQRNKIYRESADYSFVDNQLLWHGDKPDDETTYAVKFASKQQYIVWQDQGVTRGTEDSTLPRRVVCMTRPYGVSPTSPFETVPLSNPT